MAMRIRLDRLKGIKVRVPHMKRTPFLDAMGKVLGWILHRLLVFVALITMLLGISEALLYLVDTGAENYVSWTKTIVVPFIVSAICWILIGLLNLDRIRSSFRTIKRSSKVDPNLASLDLDS